MLEVCEFCRELEDLLPAGESCGNFQDPGVRVVAMKYVLAQVDSSNDLHVMDGLEASGDLAGDVATVKAHPGSEFFGRGVEIVDVVLSLIEVVAHFLVRHGDRTAAAAVGKSVLRGCGELGRRVPEAAMHVHHRLGQARVCGDHLRDFVGVGVDTHLLIEGNFTHFRDQACVVLRGEEGGVDTEDFTDSQEHRHGEWPDVVLDLIEIACRDLERLGQRSLTQPALGPQLAEPDTDKGFRHFPRIRVTVRLRKGGFAVFAQGLRPREWLRSLGTP